MRKYIPLTLMTILACLTLCVGCGSLEKNQLVSRNGTVEEVVPARVEYSVDPTTGETNRVYIPPVLYTNLAMNPIVSGGVRAVGTMVTPINPVAGLATEGALGLGTVLLGWWNWRQKKKLRGAEELNDTLLSASEELVENINTAREILKKAAPGTEQQLIEKIQQSQIAAGPEVATFIRDLVKG